jgi:phosphate transport system substrate-binding protein
MRSIVTGALICLLFSCGKPRGTTYCSVGSEELNAAMDAWAAVYKPGPAPQHEGRGSRVGAKALADGICEMAASSEILPDEDIDRIARKQSAKPEALPVAEEVLAIIASKDFPADQISIAQLVKIYSEGEQDPARLGFASGGPLKAHGINSASDRYFWFRRVALDMRTVSDRVLEAPGPLALVDRVAKGPLALGYARPLETTPHVKTLKVVQDAAALLPDAADYPLRRYYYIYVTRPSQETKAFLHFILSAEGQKSLKPLGLVPLEEHARNDALLRLGSIR